ncbi:MAG: sensor histidine kinase [Acidobacteriota bacterium]|nr:sensor histidine kinase [Acidobacteriota bacterium]
MIVAAFVLAATFLTVDRVEMRADHDPAWRSVAFDDVPAVDDAVTLRATIDLTPLDRKPNAPLGILFGGLASHELWWDGVRVGGGGIVGRTKATERPGPIEAQYLLAEELARPGLHTLVIRTSAFHRGFAPKHGYWNVVIGSYDELLRARTHRANLAMIALSGIALTGIFAFALYWLARRDRSFLLLGTLCAAAAALLIAEAWRPLFGYTYDWHIVRLRAIVAFSWLTGVQLVALVIARFPHRFGRAVLVTTAVIAAVLPFAIESWDLKELAIFYVCCGVSCAWTIFAAVRRMHGSALALIGVGVASLALVAAPASWVDYGVYFALLFLFVCLLCSHALEVRRAQDERARLELEMVRRHLQPHFLMNTLTALSEWVEEDPKTAVRMIEALSEELRLLGSISNRTLITTEEELRLCRTHVENMSLRNDAAYALEVEGVDGASLVPPAVFHTLVENAMTHGATGTLRLSSTRDGNRVRYVFEAPAPEVDEVPRAGGGTRYIEARLREAWGNAWSFRQGRSGAMWRAELDVPFEVAS